MEITPSLTDLQEVQNRSAPWRLQETKSVRVERDTTDAQGQPKGTPGLVSSKFCGHVAELSAGIFDAMLTSIEIKYIMNNHILLPYEIYIHTITQS